MLSRKDNREQQWQCLGDWQEFSLIICRLLPPVAADFRPLPSICAV
nr:MAG TPA: hypothetical protein [Caudoviricetes sp.]